jgi:myo-inositol-1(or 4)-monophosphatase
MNPTEHTRALACAVKAARAAGDVMGQHLSSAKKINSSSRHDIKLELDVRCQDLIEKILGAGFPRVALLGEEGVSGDPEAAARWVVDPIDGTVNFTYGIPHACVCIALQIKNPANGAYETVVGVVYDPFCDELWTAIRGQPARLNGKIIHVSQRGKLREAAVSIGFAKSRAMMDFTLPYFNKLARRVRKVRIMGAAGLAMTYVATGRFDAYVERGIRLWDIAAGGLIVECAGGEFWRKPVRGRHTFQMVTSNGLLRNKLQSL